MLILHNYSLRPLLGCRSVTYMHKSLHVRPINLRNEKIDTGPLGGHTYNDEGEEVQLLRLVGNLLISLALSSKRAKVSPWGTLCILCGVRAGRVYFFLSLVS